MEKCIYRLYIDHQCVDLNPYCSLAGNVSVKILYNLVRVKCLYMRKDPKQGNGSKQISVVIVRMPQTQIRFA